MWDGEVLEFSLHPPGICYAWEVDGRIAAVLEGRPG